MCFSIIHSNKFKKEARRLVKKFPSLKQELAELNNVSATNPDAGTYLGHDTYKIRLVIRNKGKAKVVGTQ